jgi:DNA segregation ATPase FtsK/SpoIIIE and related proteins
LYGFVFVEVEEDDEPENKSKPNKNMVSKKRDYVEEEYAEEAMTEKKPSNKDIINFELNDTSIKGIKNKEITKLKIEEVESEYFDKEEDSRQLNFSDIKDDKKASPYVEKTDNNPTNVNPTDNISEVEGKTVDEYKLPSSGLLRLPKKKATSGKEDLRKDADKLIQTLRSFNIDCSVSQISKGPTITRYEILPAPGIKVSKITSLQNDIALNLATSDIRMEAPIPGKSAIGIEVPNKEKSDVLFRGLVESSEFKEIETKIPFALGKDIAGKNIIGSIEKMPHLLVAGATGSGKSVCINTLIMSILYKAKPDEVKLILVDPKVVELSVYNGIPHLLIPVVTDPRKASNALNWAVSEMTTRYKVFALKQR